MSESGPTGARTSGPVLLELSRAQVDQVVRDAQGAGSLSALLLGLSDARNALNAAHAHLDDAGLSRTLLSGLLLLAAFPADASSVRVLDLAEKLDMNITTAHRYVSTLFVAGLLDRDHETREYRLAYTGS